MDNKDQQEMLGMVERALNDFRQGMEYREQLSIRIGKRTTQIIRFGMTALSILGLALFYLIFILTKDFSNITRHMTQMSAYMSNMDSSFTTVTGTITEVEKTLLKLNEHITVMPALNGSVGSMDANLGLLRTDLNSMVKQIEYMNGNVLNMSNSMQLLNNQLNEMNRAVGSMAADIHQMAKPMKVMPF